MPRRYGLPWVWAEGDLPGGWVWYDCFTAVRGRAHPNRPRHPAELPFVAVNADGPNGL